MACEARSLCGEHVHYSSCPGVCFRGDCMDAIAHALLGLPSSRGIAGALQPVT
jgi:hypothetical protein